MATMPGKSTSPHGSRYGSSHRCAQAADATYDRQLGRPAPRVVEGAREALPLLQLEVRQEEGQHDRDGEAGGEPRRRPSSASRATGRATRRRTPRRTRPAGPRRCRSSRTRAPAPRARGRATHARPAVRRSTIAVHREQRVGQARRHQQLDVRDVREHVRAEREDDGRHGGAAAMAREVPDEAVRPRQRQHEGEEHDRVVREVRVAAARPVERHGQHAGAEVRLRSTPACRGAGRRCWRCRGPAGSTTSVRATHATFQMLNWPSPESMRPAEAPRTASGHVITTVMRRAAATTRTASPARERMGPYGSMTTHAARPPDAVVRARRGVRGCGRVVFARHARAQRHRRPRGPGGTCCRRYGGSPRSSPGRWRWRGRFAFRRTARSRSSSAPSSSCRGCPFRLPPAALLWAGPFVWLVWVAIAAAVLSARRRRRCRRAAAAGRAVEPRARAVGGVCLRGARLQRSRVAPGAASAGRRRTALPRHRAEPLARRRPSDREQPSARRLPRVLRRRAAARLPEARDRRRRSTRFTCRACRRWSRRCSPWAATAWSRSSSRSSRRLPRPSRGGRRTSLTGSAAAAWFGWAGAALTAPFLLLSFTVYPDGPGAVVVMLAFALVAELQRRASRPAWWWAGAGVLPALLPWFHPRFAVLAAALGAVFAVRALRDATAGSRARRVRRCCRPRARSAGSATTTRSTAA